MRGILWWWVFTPCRGRQRLHLVLRNIFFQKPLLMIFWLPTIDWLTLVIDLLSFWINLCWKLLSFFSIHCEQNFELADLKSVNIIRWVAWTMGQMNRRPSVWCSNCYFFSWFLAKFFAKILSIYFLIFFYKITKIEIKSFECPKSINNYEKNNAWNIRQFFDESFVPSTQCIILKITGFLILYSYFILVLSKKFDRIEIKLKIYQDDI